MMNTLLHNEIKQVAGLEDWEAHKHQLAALNDAMLARLLMTMNKGSGLPLAYKILYLGKGFQDKNYERFLNWAIPKYTGQQLAKTSLNNTLVLDQS